MATRRTSSSRRKHTNSEKFTQEVRLTGKSDRLDWLAGVYYTSEDGLIDQDFIAVEPGTLDPHCRIPLLGLAEVEFGI